MAFKKSKIVATLGKIDVIRVGQSGRYYNIACHGVILADNIRLGSVALMLAKYYSERDVNMNKIEDLIEFDSKYQSLVLEIENYNRLLKITNNKSKRQIYELKLRITKEKAKKMAADSNKEATELILQPLLKFQ